MLGRISGALYEDETNLLVGNFQVQLPPKGVGEVCEELGLEDAVHQRVWLLSAHHQREPVVFQVGCADGLDRSDRYRPL